jgi:hypothetical protein
VWSREIAGRRLTFHLAGINNQNFLMRDDETGSFWQQISGRAISGPLQGRELTLIFSDELTFAAWKAEEPQGTVLAADPHYASEYEAKNWDVKMRRTPTVIQFAEQGMQARDLVLGIRASGASRAFIYQRVIQEKLVKDHVGAGAVILVVGADGQSVRAFRDQAARLPPATDDAPDFYRLNNAQLGGALMLDASTGSEWNFSGCAISGKEKGVCLEPVPLLKDYWFDWREYNPGTTVWGHGRH